MEIHDSERFIQRIKVHDLCKKLKSQCDKGGDQKDAAGWGGGCPGHTWGSSTVLKGMDDLGHVHVHCTSRCKCDSPFFPDRNPTKAWAYLSCHCCTMSVIRHGAYRA